MRSKFLALIPVVLIGLMIAGFAYVQIGDPNADVSPSVNSEFVTSEADTIPPAGFPFPTAFNFNYSLIGGVNAGTVGAMWLNGKYYFNRWSSTKIYTYNDNGPGGGPGTLVDSLNYVGSCRDLATDGTYLYGGPASTVLYRLDPNTGATLKTFTLAGGSTRALAWDPNRKGFWNTNFGGNIFFHDTNGVLKQTITSTLTAKYGMGWDSTSSPDSAFLWVWNQGPGGATNELYKIHIGSGLVKASYIFTLTGPSTGIAGGAEVVIKNNQLLLLLNFQNQALVGKKMKDLSLPVPTGVWSEQTSGIATVLYSVSAVDDNVAWAAGAAGKVLRTTNKGLTWTTVTAPNPNDIYTIYAFDQNKAMVTSSPSTGTFAYITTNGGANWTQVLAQTGGFFDDIQFKDANNGFLYGDPVGGRLTLFKTTNGGFNWDSAGLYYPTALAGWNNGMYVNGDKVFIGTNSGNLIYSSNFGSSFSLLATGLTNTYVTWFNNASVGLTGGASFMATTNGGTNWAATTVPSTGNSSGVTGRQNSWWVTRQGTSVYFSSNNGTSWASQYTAPAGNFYHITMSRNGSSIWGVRSNGGIARYGLVTGVNPISSTTPDNYSLGQNYPNPFNPTTNINFSIPKSGLVTMKVFDILGKEVATLVNGNFNAGSYTVDFNASSYASGVYFYRLDVNGFTEVKRMMLVK